MTPESYWNNKYPKNEIIYDGRGIRGYPHRIPVDVRSMISSDSNILKKIVPHIQGNGTYDSIAHHAQKWVVANIKYVGDKKNTGLEECWQYPNETLATKKGDCEDGAILLASLLLNAGVPAWRVRVTAGLVSAGKGAATGGHAYVTYCREKDNNWVVLDWCYLEDSSRPVAKKPIFKTLKPYKDIWFSFNHLYSWSHKSFTNFPGVK